MFLKGNKELLYILGYKIPKFFNKLINFIKLLYLIKIIIIIIENSGE